jgi:hypothetical protein
VRYFLVAFCIFLGCMRVSGQQVTVRGGFFSDSVSIGEETRYFLTARYPSKLNLLFPDSSSLAFQPFEYNSRQYFPTETTDSLSYDSVIYRISTFEVDRVQGLALAVFLINNNDTLFYKAESDSIKVTQMVAHVPDTIPANKLPLKMNTAYQKVPFLFNYLLFIIVGIGVLLIAAIFFLVFGKGIRRHYRLKRLKRNHDKFVKEFGDKLATVNASASAENTEATLATWKKYLEQLEGWPYTKLTTRETMIMEKDEGLGKSLQQIDRAIYGHEGAVLQPLTSLRDYADKKFNRKLDEVKHGK